LASSAIFATNAILSLLEARWVLATLQLTTAALAAAAALDASDGGATPSSRPEDAVARKTASPSVEPGASTGGAETSSYG
jgi:hypothetical protein